MDDEEFMAHQIASLQMALRTVEKSVSIIQDMVTLWFAVKRKKEEAKT